MEDEGTLLDEVGGLMNVCGLAVWRNLSCILARRVAFCSDLVCKIILSMLG